MSAPTVATKWVYDFAEGSREMRVLLGGKGANIAEMTRVLGADLVPAGFTDHDGGVRGVHARRPHAARRAGRSRSPTAIARLEERTGRRLGDPDDPLLVSVRSGARDSMPGMLETILDLGLNDASVRGLAARTGDERFAWDSYRRFVQMFGNVVCGVPGERFEERSRAAARRAACATTGARRGRAARADAPLPGALRGSHGRAVPQDPREQLRLAVRAVFDSWLRRSRGRLPPHQPHPGRLGHGGQRPADGVRQPRRAARLPAWRSRATR